MEFIDSNKHSGNTLHGLSELEKSVTSQLLPKLEQSDTSNNELQLNNSNNYRQSIAIENNININDEQKLSEMAKQQDQFLNQRKVKSIRKTSNELEKQKKKLSGNNENNGYIINDIRGEYFDDRKYIR